MTRETAHDTAASVIGIAANRAAQKWSKRELLGRALWETLRAPLFSWTPRPFWAWRRMILRLFGARIGPHVHIDPSVYISVPWNLDIANSASVGEFAILYSLGPICIGAGATVSQRAHICAGTHDHTRLDLPLQKMPITIGAGVWICADAFVGPGVTIADLAVIGARSVVTRNVPERTIVAGNPARSIGQRRLS